MRLLAHAIFQNSTSLRTAHLKTVTSSVAYNFLLSNRFLSTNPNDGGNEGNKVGRNNDIDWGDASSWSSGLTKEDFEGEVVGQKISGGDGTGTGTGTAVGSISSVDGGKVDSSLFASARWTEQESQYLRKLASDALRREGLFEPGWRDRTLESSVLMKQVMEPGVRGSYLTDSEKAEMYRLHKENPEVYTVERLAKDYKIMRQRVHAILWLKEDQEEMEKKLGHPLDDSVERLLDNFPEYFKSHDREFHVASLPYKPDFKVMPEDWDGTTKDPDEVHYELSMKEDEMLYEEFLLRFNFNKMKVAGEVKVHKYSRRRSPEGWEITVEKMGPQGKRGNAGGWKFKSLPDGSTRPLNEYEKMFVKIEKPRRRRKIIRLK